MAERRVYKYEFNDFQDIENYWFTLQWVCCNTSYGEWLTGCTQSLREYAKSLIGYAEFLIEYAESLIEHAKTLIEYAESLLDYVKPYRIC